jgi:hypothetical protein
VGGWVGGGLFVREWVGAGAELRVLKEAGMLRSGSESPLPPPATQQLPPFCRRCCCCCREHPVAVTRAEQAQHSAKQQVGAVVGCRLGARRAGQNSAAAAPPPLRVWCLPPASSALLLCSRALCAPYPRRTGKRLPASSDIRVIDFGSAIFNSDYHSSVVSTRHYR